MTLLNLSERKKKIIVKASIKIRIVKNQQRKFY
jgi:hypothetical protein